ncbi:hypothetical protein GQX74_005281 [Glossina fuscipes]|nr:hypothetical protein GQX74_005281 [Glossina fuscipes]
MVFDGSDNGDDGNEADDDDNDGDDDDVVGIVSAIVIDNGALLNSKAFEPLKPPSRWPFKTLSIGGFGELEFCIPFAAIVLLLSNCNCSLEARNDERRCFAGATVATCCSPPSLVIDCVSAPQSSDVVSEISVPQPLLCDGYLGAINCKALGNEKTLKKSVVGAPRVTADGGGGVFLTAAACFSNIDAFCKTDARERSSFSTILEHESALEGEEVS